MAFQKYLILCKCFGQDWFYYNLSELGLYNKIMFEQLLACFASSKPYSDQSVGRIIDLLRTIPYFEDINSNFGSDYLVFMIPILQPQVLRGGFSLLGEYSQYLLVEGDLDEVNEEFQASRVIDLNTLIDLRESIGVRFTARSDCKVIKIKKGQEVNPNFQKKLILTEKDRTLQMTKLKKLIKNKDNKDKLLFLRVIEFFNSLGEFDLLDLAVQSQIKEYHQSSVTHTFGEDVDNIGCVLNGKVKLTFPASQQQSKKGQGVSTFICEGEWIGLEQYLWDRSLSSNGQASSIAALLVWIPRDIFKSKFNLKTNYHTMNRLISLIQTKKIIFDKSLHCRRKRESELNNQEQTLKYLNATLIQKISAMTANQSKRNHFNKTKSPKPLEMPQHILHKSNKIDPNVIIYLPKVTERVNLFPDQYQQTPISVLQLRQMQRLAKIANKIPLGQPKQPQTNFEQNPQTLYKTILSKIPQSYTPSINSRFSKTITSSGFRQHSSPIYNNFRISKANKKDISVYKSKTLNILS